MAVRNALYLFEVVVESVKSFVESRLLVIRSEFGDVFSLELKDPKQMYIVIPEPPPLPPEPPKKGKKKPAPKKGKKGKVELPPPEPVIQSGQSLLFTSNAEFLIQTMKAYPLELSLWNKDDTLTCIGASIIQWDPIFLKYLEGIYNCESPPCPVVRDEYNVFEEGTAKLMARVGLQVKLSCLTATVTCSFRTLSEDPVIKKVLYTGMNSKTTSYICNYKTTDADFEDNCNKIENNYTIDTTPVGPPKIGGAAKPIRFADYKNAPAANVAVFDDDKFCCLHQSDKPPDSKYKAPETCPDVDFIVDYVRKVITSCNDNMRMLTPRPTIRPRVKATDIDRLCYCRETRWPDGDLADRFKREVKSGPCPLCINAKIPGEPREKTMDIANVRGPCGRPDCKIARHMRAYLEKLLAEDNVVVTLDDIIGPCGSKVCTVAEKIQEFIRHEGVFNDVYTKEGLQTQCDCAAMMRKAFFKTESCSSICTKDCKGGDDICEGQKCVFKKNMSEGDDKKKIVYDMFYFTVEYDFDNKDTISVPGSSRESRAASPMKAKTVSPNQIYYDPPISNFFEPAKAIQFANYINAPAANIAVFDDDRNCCLHQTDKTPESKEKSLDIYPDIDGSVNKVKKLITSCNDNIKMLTPRPTKPGLKASDIDPICNCRETRWPNGDLAERFKREVNSGPCPLCINAKISGEPLDKTIDMAKVRGPCGKADCKIARDMTDYLGRLLTEDNVTVTLDDIIGPCGSKICTVAETIREFIRHEGVFKDLCTETRLQTQCDCLEKMPEAFFHTDSSSSICATECKYRDDVCVGTACINNKKGTEDKKVPQKVYNVYYFTVEYDEKAKDDTSPSATPTTKTSKSSNANDDTKSKDCNDTCPTKMSSDVTCSKSSCAQMILNKKSKSDVKCMQPYCRSKIQAGIVSPADSDIVIKLEDINNPCCVKTCDVAETVKDFIEEGYLKRKKQASREKDPDEVDSCYCACECSFRFTTKTTYCGICGGYECAGDDVKTLPEYAKPHPCPVYHKLYDRKLIKTKSPWPEPQPEQHQPAAADAQSSRSTRTTMSKQHSIAGERKFTKTMSEKNVKDAKKSIKKKKITKSPDEVVDEKEPMEKKVSKIGQTAVPKNMGWLWTAEDIPGMKFRPKWKPGAANKILVRRYRQVREGVDNIAKKKRAMMNRKKKIEMKPTLIVKKTDGEYTVQMEVFKKYSKERLLFQYPYDEKPSLVYTIGKTEEEKIKVQKKRERRERRENRRKSRLIQSTFRDKCQEICLKAYNQAMGVLPLPNPNEPFCPCEVNDKPPSPIIDSCSCSDSVSITSSDTDGDDWIIEFTPPAARWDAKAKHPPTLSDDETQYTYLDYKVKITDKQGNPIPRFFTGPDGKQECSDLGGFWGPGHVWLEINKDGFLGPDGRWVPLNFTGPDGMYYSSEDGIYTDSEGVVWKIGVDGYIDVESKWQWYPKKRGKGSTSTMTTDTKRSPRKQLDAVSKSPDPKGKSGNSPKPTENKTHSTEKSPSPLATESKVKSAHPPEKTKKDPKKTTSFTAKGKAPLVMNVSMNYEGRRSLHKAGRTKLLDVKKLDHYKEIMQGLKVYDDLCELEPLPSMANRACNTPRKKISPFTMDPGYGRRKPQRERDIASTIAASTSSLCKS